ncbi:hypothetical protein ACLKA7_016074 [Drosophila subpalustris]
MWGLGTLPEGFPAAAYAAYAAGRGYSGYPSFGLPYPTAGVMGVLPENRILIGLTICGIGRSYNTTCSPNTGRSRGATTGPTAGGGAAASAAVHSQPQSGYQHHQALTLPLATALTARTAAIKSQFLGNINF